MSQKMTPLAVLLNCMKQKVVLLTKILNITKMMEVQSQQKEVDLGGLPDERQTYIDRLKKCEGIIKKACLSVPEEKQAEVKGVLAGKFPDESCSTPEEKELLHYGIKCSSLLSMTLPLDRECRKNLQKECDRLRSLIHTSSAGSNIGTSHHKTKMF
ncbi:MAG TPA: hypothetical protein DG942_06235 [Ruminococcaceae bacterium]|jgi:hypothetical protein|nr:hypothetical protein [Oscillospiraceae bacterium]